MFIELDGIKINYTAEKCPGACCGNVLLLHGWGANITLFSNIIEKLKPYCNVYAPDMPGFGESTEPKEAWCVSDYSEFIEKFCSALHISNENLAVIGHSFGGRVIIKGVTGDWKSVKPEKVILVDSAGIRPKKTLKGKINSAAYKAGKKILSVKPVQAVFPDALENLRNKRGSADYKAASPLMRQTLVKVVNEDLEPLLPEIKQPVLLFWGTVDDATPLSDAQTMEKLIPDSGLVTVEGAGHFSFLENPLLFARVVFSFLNITQ